MCFFFRVFGLSEWLCWRRTRVMFNTNTCKKGYAFTWLCPVYSRLNLRALFHYDKLGSSQRLCHLWWTRFRFLVQVFGVCIVSNYVDWTHISDNFSCTTPKHLIAIDYDGEIFWYQNLVTTWISWSYRAYSFLNFCENTFIWNNLKILCRV